MIIGLSGKAGSGKDAAVSYLCQNYGFKRYAFADRIKSIAFDLFGIEYDTKDERGRKIYQEIGTAMREIDPNVWVNTVMRQIASQPISLTTLHAAIADVRFPNEVEAIVKAGGFVVRVSRPESDRLNYLNQKYGGYSSERLNHISETALDYYDGNILQIYAETLDEMYAQLDPLTVKSYTVSQSELVREV